MKEFQRSYAVPITVITYAAGSRIAAGHYLFVETQLPVLATHHSLYTVAYLCSQTGKTGLQ